MNPEVFADRELLLRQLGAGEERIRRLERLLEQQSQWESEAREWRRLQRHRCELAEWLVDGATNESGRLVKPLLDAGLRGEQFVPCSLTATINGQRYRFDLATTQYEIRVTDENG